MADETREIDRLRAEVAELRQQVEVLARSEEKFRTLFHAMHDVLAVYELGPDGRTRRFVEINAAALDRLGYTREEFAGIPPEHVDGGGEPAIVQRVAQEVAACGHATFRTRLRAKTGEEFPVEGNARLAQLDGAPVAIVSFRDVSERERAEQALRESEEHYRLLAEHASDVIWTMGLDFQLTYISPSVARVFGYTPEEMMALPIEERLSSESSALVREALAAELARRPVSPDAHHAVTLELTARRKDGGDLVTEVTASVLRDAAGQATGVLGVTRDITARKRGEAERAQLEEQLRQSQKLEAIGTLAGGVAHDMNSILGVIMGLASMCEATLPADSLERDNVERILAACEKGRDLTRNLLGFARRGKYLKRRFSLNRVVREVRELLQHTLPKGIRLRTHLGRDLPRVEGDPSQISQALLNLCLNAADAMDGRGPLTISTERLTKFAQGGNELPAEAAGDFVRLAVRDSGRGMDEETLSHVFEPFYTTKEPGEGTGLGLAMVYGTARNHGGWIDLESHPGRGTLATLILPALAVAESEQPAAVEAPAALQRGDATVLLIDDEEDIQEACGLMLETLGYRVLVAGSGTAALELWRARGDEIDAVVLDLKMPGMTGDETFHALREVDPEVPVLVASGYAEETGVSELLAAGARGFLPKPFSLRQLSVEMARILAPS